MDWPLHLACSNGALRRHGLRAAHCALENDAVGRQGCTSRAVARGSRGVLLRCERRRQETSWEGSALVFSWWWSRSSRHPRHPCLHQPPDASARFAGGMGCGVKRWRRALLTDVWRKKHPFGGRWTVSWIETARNIVMSHLKRRR